jgi:hypothetical protein
MHSIFRFALPAFCTVTCAAALIAPLAAQANEGASRTINQRQALQQRRIFEGVQDEQISGKEYRNLERRSLSIEAQQRRDVRDGGSFTPRERYQLNQRLNNVSNSIYHDRRN